ncbi:MAG: hypothetical protein LBK98_04690 [Peptococcaceae bacterium]|jgi:hypothetical protein|nr:hypothetical protein [Peptococcaceae bacterium]
MTVCKEKIDNRFYLELRGCGEYKESFLLGTISAVMENASVSPQCRLDRIAALLCTYKAFSELSLNDMEGGHSDE